MDDSEYKETFKIHVNSVLTHVKLAKELQAKDKLEVAVQHYVLASNKLY